MPEIHPSAIVSERANLADDVTVGPFAIVDEGVVIGDGCKIGAQVWIAKNVVIGDYNKVGYGSIIGADPQSQDFDTSKFSNVTIGDHNEIREYVTIHRSIEDKGSTSIKDHNYLMTGVHLAHDVEMGNHNCLANNVLIAGHVRIGDHTFLGGGSGFHQFIHIGSYSMVQGNSVVSRDVPPFCTAHGRNELAGLNVIGLRRGGFTKDERSDIKRAYHLLFRSGGNLTESLLAVDELDWLPCADQLLESARNPSRKGLISRNSQCRS